MKRVLLALLIMLPTSLFARDVMDGELWKSHWENDIKPWWVDKSATGVPAGNFPSARELTGTPVYGDQYIRMVSRQVYTYAMGYQLTGDETLLTYAQKGIDWITKNGRDDADGFKGFYAILDGHGNSIGADKTSQDQAYAVMGYAAMFHITGEKRYAAPIDEMRELLFNGPFWDQSNNAPHDALTEDLTTPVEFKSEGLDSVSVLDHLNAYLMLYYNSLENGHKRNKVFSEISTLGDLVYQRFYKEGIFWNTELNRTDWDGDHVDIGHSIKSYWLLERIGLALKAQGKDPKQFLAIQENALQMLQASANEYGAYGQRFAGAYNEITDHRAAWWVHCELDQYAALRLKDNAQIVTPILQKSGQFWFNFVDTGRAVRGIREGIQFDGSLWGDEDSWTSKQSSWKNGYHETERALWLYLMLNQQQKKPSTLYYAFTPYQFAKRLWGNSLNPYIFNGDIVGIKIINKIKGTDRYKIAVTYKNIN
jgi:mannose/cellobiose epimerase-like protein (N-acyl-D-glucosamine 2-epimerase family)